MKRCRSDLVPVVLVPVALLVASAAAASPGVAAPVPVSRVTRAALSGLGPDFNGDGYADYAIGGGGVVVRYGGGDPSEKLSPPEGGPSAPGALAVGDFDADGFDDLAVGGGVEGGVDGAVLIYYGSAAGLVGGSTQPAPQVLTQSDLIGQDTPLANFGSVLAAGDVTGDGVDDLAVAAPAYGFSDGRQEAGRVTVVPGASGQQLGATTTAVLLHQDSPGTIGVPEEFDRFGAGLAIGDLTGDGTGDLVVAATGENGVGMVHVLPGGAGGPSGAGSTAVAGTSVPGLRGTDSEGSQAYLGISLAVADVTGDGDLDVVAGAPQAKSGFHEADGAVVVFAGTGAGIDKGHAQLVNQSTPGVAGSAEDDDQFGSSVAVGDLDGDGGLEVVVGSRGEAIGNRTGAGMYTVLRPSPAGVTGTGSYAVHQDTAHVDGTPEFADSFAATLGLQDVDADGRADVLAGVPGENAYKDSRAVTGPSGAVAVLVSDPAGRPAARSLNRYGANYGVQFLGEAIAASAARLQ